MVSNNRPKTVMLNSHRRRDETVKFCRAGMNWIGFTTTQDCRPLLVWKMNVFRIFDTCIFVNHFTSRSPTRQDGLVASRWRRMRIGQKSKYIERLLFPKFSVGEIFWFCSRWSSCQSKGIDRSGSDLVSCRWTKASQDTCSLQIVANSITFTQHERPTRRNSTVWSHRYRRCELGYLFTCICTLYSWTQ